MDGSYLDKLEEDGAPMPTTVSDVIQVKMDMLREVLDEIEYMSSSDFTELQRKQKSEALTYIRKTIKTVVPRNERDLNRLADELIDRLYHNAMEHLYE